MRFAVSLGIVFLLWACAENRAPQQPQQQQAEGTLPPPDVPYGPDARDFYAPTTPSPDMLRRDSLEALTAARNAFLDSLKAKFQYPEQLPVHEGQGELRSHNLAFLASVWQEMTTEDPRYQESWELVYSPFVCEDLLRGRDSSSFLPCARLVGLPWRVEVEEFFDYDEFPDSLYTLHFPDGTKLPFRRVVVNRTPYEKPTPSLPGRMDLISCKVYTPRLLVRGGLRVGSHRREVLQQLNRQVYPMLEFDNLIVISDYNDMFWLEFHLRADTVYCIRSGIYQG